MMEPLQSELSESLARPLKE